MAMASDKFQIHTTDDPTREDESALLSGICDEAYKAKGQPKIERFGAFLKDPSNKVFGGVSGAIFYGCVDIDQLWVDKTLRHQGWGTKLMDEAEKIGKQHGCTFASTRTMDWEALNFYQERGYLIDFVRDGFAKQSKMYFLRKRF